MKNKIASVVYGLHLIITVNLTPLPEIQTGRTVQSPANVEIVSTTFNTQEGITTDASIPTLPKNIDKTIKFVDTKFLQLNDIKTGLSLQANDDRTKSESHVHILSTPPNQDSAASRSGQGNKTSQTTNVGVHKILSLRKSNRPYSCVDQNEVKTKLKTVYNFSWNLLTIYCNFVRNDPSKLLNTAPCHQLEMTSPIPISTTSITNMASFIKDKASDLKATADTIYNISYIVLLQEACYPCNYGSLQSMAAKSLWNLTSDYPIFNQFIHFLHVLEDAISTLTCSLYQKQRSVPLAPVLRNVSYYITDTRSVVTELITIKHFYSHNENHQNAKNS